MGSPTMQALTKNGFEYYKSKEYWEPLDAALIVCSISPSIKFYDSIPEKVKEIYEKSVSDYKNGKISFYKKKEIYGKSYIEFCRKYFQDFCQKRYEECIDCEECDSYGDCEQYECLYLVCFHPCAYIKWIMDSKLTEIPKELMIKQDKRYGCSWRSKIDWDSKEPNSVETDKSVKLVPFLENQSGNLDRELQSMFDKMKKYDYWTLKEAIMLLDNYILFALSNKAEIENGFDLQPYIRAIKAGTLRVINFDREEAKAKGWNIKFTDLEISPFEFLEFVKEKELFEIPSELKYIKKQSGSGDVQYFWATESNTESEKKLRPDQEVKNECQKIAKRVWEEYPILDIKHLKEHPEIKKIVGKQYKIKTLHKWLSEVAPENAKKQGQRPKDIREEQEKICKKIGKKI